MTSAEYDSPLCREHQKEMLAALNQAKICVAISLVLAFIAGFAFCKMTGG